MRCFNSYNILQLKIIIPCYIYLLLVQCSDENERFLHMDHIFVSKISM
jgi:hypothetical protein